MKCPKCHFEDPDDSSFCRKCGSLMAQDISCPNRGAIHPPDSNFCNKCGHNLQEPEEIPPIDYFKPKSYVPNIVADKILTKRSSIEGERKLVSVLFADVANFTALSEKLDLERLCHN